MRYTIETSNTIAGSVLVGIYDTLAEAKFAAKIEILRTCGGPSCYILRDTNAGDSIVIHVSDGHQQHYKTVWLANVADYLDELVNNV